MKANETSKAIEGIGVGNGKASGRLRFLASPKAVDRPKPKASHGDARHEWERLSAALSLAEEQIGRLFRRALETLGEEEARIFEIHGMLRLPTRLGLSHSCHRGNRAGAYSAPCCHSS